MGWCSIRLCFLDVVPYKEDTTPSLFRTRFVRCYALPCISIKLWRSTCKPYGIGPSCHLCCIVLYLYLFKVGKSTNTVYSKKKTRSLRYIDTDFRWADSRGIRYNRFYVIANYVISVVTCIHFKWSSAGPRRGLRNNRELRYIGLRYTDSWLYYQTWHTHSEKEKKRKKESSKINK